MGVVVSATSDAAVSDCVVRMIAAGLFDRYPGLRIVIRSGGGGVPLLQSKLWWKHKSPGGAERQYVNILRDHFLIDTASVTPRGLAGPFSGYDDCGPYPFERRSEHAAEPPLAHDIYIWNGKSALALTKAVALTKCFELERYLINDDVGAVHHLHRGCCGAGGGELLPAAALYRTDYSPPKLPEV